MKFLLLGVMLIAPINEQSVTLQDPSINGRDTLSLSLEDAVTRALEVSPRVAAAEAAVFAPRGERAESLWPFPENPRLEYSRARRRGLGVTSYDHEWRLSQEIELAGQSFIRASAAGKRIRSAEARVADARRITSLEARLRYLALQIANRRAALTDSSAAFARRLSVMARKRMDAGEVNRLEYNTAVLEAARAQSRANRAATDRRAASAQLARVLALPADSIVQPMVLPEIPDLVMSDARLLAIANQGRPDLRADSLAAEAAARTVTALRLESVPSLELAGFTGREERTDDVRGFSAALNIPLFHRRQAGVGRAKAVRGASIARVTATRRRILAEVVAAGALFHNAREAERRFATEALEAANQNGRLGLRAFEEGEADLTQAIVFQSVAVGAQLEYLEVLREAYGAWFGLASSLAVRPGRLPELLGVNR